MTDHILKNTEENQNILNFLFEGMPRKDQEYIKEGRRSRNKNESFSIKLRGNIGRMLFTGNSEGDCGNWIAGSPRAHSITRDPIHAGSSNNIYIGSLPLSRQLYFGTFQEAQPFPEQLPYLPPDGLAYNFDEMELFGADGQLQVAGDKPGHHSRPFPFEDSEYLLLNGLAYILNQHKVDTGNVYLMTERIPCRSCTQVINGFSEMFPKILVNIIYLGDSGSRNAKHFLKDCTCLQRVSLTHFKRTEGAYEVSPTFVRR